VVVAGRVVDRVSLRKGGDADIYVARSDGTDLQMVAGGPGEQVNPVWGTADVSKVTGG
jgi:hypothetical protein